MRKLALAFLLVLVACSGNVAKVDKRTFEGGPGDPIDVQFVGSSRPMMMFAMRGAADMAQQVSFQFEVSNNSDESLTVQRIQVYQHGTAPIQLESGQAGFDETIEPGHDHTFTVYTTARQLRDARQGDDLAVIIRADVALTNGDSYVYSFSVPVSVSVQ